MCCFEFLVVERVKFRLSTAADTRTEGKLPYLEIDPNTVFFAAVR